MAPSVAIRLQAAFWGERLAVVSGRIVELKPADEGFEAVVVRRGGREPVRRRYAAVVNCTGPAGDLHRLPLLRDLLDRGLVRPDPLRLGLDVDRDGRVLGSGGAPSPSLYAVGPLTRGAFWEAVAVPDLRGRTAELAAAVLADFAQPGRSAHGRMRQA
jgi:uncharacterized NAD(P)/FAD-binding protein YdhS